MDNGGWKFIYDNKPFMIADETDYFAVYLEHKQVAAFKKKEDAFDYVEYARNKIVRDSRDGY